MTTLQTMHRHAVPTAPIKVPSFGKDPLGLRAGWRGFVMWRDLNSLSDAELAARGVKRADIPALAMAALLDRD